MRREYGIRSVSQSQIVFVVSDRSQAPVLSIFVVAIQNSSSLLPQHEDFKEKEPLSPTRAVTSTRPPYLYVYTLITILALSQANPLIGAHLEICWVFAQGAFYYGLFNRVSRSSGNRNDVLIESIYTLSELSYFMVPVTLSFVFLKWDDLCFSQDEGFVALLKACRIVTTFVLVNYLDLPQRVWC